MKNSLIAVILALFCGFISTPAAHADDAEARKQIKTSSQRPIPKNPPGQPQNLGSNVVYYYIQNTSDRAITVKYTVKMKGDVIGGKTITLKRGQKESVSIDTTDTGHSVVIDEANFD